MQKITSAKTSRNQVSKGLKHVPMDTQNHLNYGGGKYNKGTEFLADKGIKSRVYDPYNRMVQENEMALLHGPFDFISCDNVLNVMEEKADRVKLYNHINSLMTKNGSVLFGIYQGNGSGIGEKTKDGYQLNRKIAGFVNEIKEVFPNCRKYKGFLIVEK